MDNKVDYAKLSVYLANHMHHWFEKDAGYKDKKDYKAVIGISGGKDSAVAAAIACEALGKENVYGVLLPNHGNKATVNDAAKVCRHLDITWTMMDIGVAYADMMFGLKLATESNSDFGSADYYNDRAVTTNLPARLRMCVLYSMAAHLNARVIGTGNWSEGLVGWTTLWGDSACDYNPLARLFVDEVIEVGRAIGNIPEEILTKPPEDGMSGRTDEENLGFTYAELKAVMVNGSGNDVSQEKRSEIMNRATAAGFKRNLTMRIPHAEIVRHADGSIDVEQTIDAFGQF